MIDQLFSSFRNIHVAVVGDVMLDTYWWGNTDRISPEAPVPVIALSKKEFRIGGAGNVALNLARLGARVSMHSVTGADEDGLLLEMMVKDAGVDTEGIWKSAERLTTNKIRIISRSQQLLRIDNEITTDLSGEEEKRFVDKTIAQFEAQRPDAVIFEDYNKGLLTQGVITALLQWCQKHKVITAVDPKRKNFFAYQGVNIFKPNLKETKDALNLADITPGLDSLKQIHEQLKQQLQHDISFITLSEKGVFYCNENGGEILPAHLRNISDVSGAGDTVIATATLVYAATGDERLMAEVANIAGGLVCEQVGTVAIDGHLLQEECTRLLGDSYFGTAMADG
jgi:rfaE bifunctional protein kinase chain/domain